MNFYCKELQEVNPLIKQNKNCKLCLRQNIQFCVFKIKGFDFALGEQDRHFRPCVAFWEKVPILH